MHRTLGHRAIVAGQAAWCRARPKDRQIHRGAFGGIGGKGGEPDFIEEAADVGCEDFKVLTGGSQYYNWAIRPPELHA